MRCCPAGHGLAGLDGTRELLCTRVGESASETCFVDPAGAGATVRAGVHACPPGTYVRGLRPLDGALTCCFDSARGVRTGAERLDRDSRLQGLRACPKARPLVTGLGPGADLLLCAEPR